jgi:endonuclease YncB( thermonuclease family)
MPFRRMTAGKRRAPLSGFALLALVVVAIVAAEERGLLWPEEKLSKAAGPSPAASLAGSAHVIDGDTIDVGGTRIRLWGIDAPEAAQTCQGEAGTVYECGRDATAVMIAMTRGRWVECAERDRDRYGRIVANCRTEAGEINAAMVRRGWAVDYRRHSGGAYRAEG